MGSKFQKFCSANEKFCSANGLILRSTHFLLSPFLLSPFQSHIYVFHNTIPYFFNTFSIFHHSCFSISWKLTHFLLSPFLVFDNTIPYFFNTFSISCNPTFMLHYLFLKTFSINYLVAMKNYISIHFLSESVFPSFPRTREERSELRVRGYATWRVMSQRSVPPPFPPVNPLGLRRSGIGRSTCLRSRVCNVS